MALAGLIDAIGIGGTLLTTIGFIQSNLPTDTPPEGAALKIKVGLNRGDDESQLDGNLAAVYAWDTSNNYLGQGSGSNIDSGGVYDVIVGQDVPGIRAEYVGLSGGKDAICIAWVTVKMYDETEGGAWTGDIGYNCGQSWYEQAEFAGYIDKDGEQSEENRYYPRCTWLDGDHSNDIISAAAKFRTLAYGEEVTDTLANDAACSATSWGDDTGPITGDPSGKRSAEDRVRPDWFDERLVVSNVTRHRAESLCSSETSWGPDFVSEIDGYFCDMKTKTLTPLCSTLSIDGCLDVDSATKTVTKRATVARRDVQLLHKSYGKVDVWGR